MALLRGRRCALLDIHHHINNDMLLPFAPLGLEATPLLLLPVLLLAEAPSRLSRLPALLLRCGGIGASANFDLGSVAEPVRALVPPSPLAAPTLARLSALLLPARELGTVVPEEVRFRPSLEEGGRPVSDPVRFLQGSEWLERNIVSCVELTSQNGGLWTKDL